MQSQELEGIVEFVDAGDLQTAIAYRFKTKPLFGEVVQPHLVATSLINELRWLGGGVMVAGLADRLTK